MKFIKRCVYMLALTAGLAQAAASSSGTPKTMMGTDYIPEARYLSMVRQEIEAMAQSSLDDVKLKSFVGAAHAVTGQAVASSSNEMPSPREVVWRQSDKVYSVYNIEPIPAMVYNTMIRQGIKALTKSDPAALESPIGKIYVAIDQVPDGINALGKKPEVTDSALMDAYRFDIFQDPWLQSCIKKIKKLVAKGSPEVERIAALSAFGCACITLQRAVAEGNIRGLKLRQTVKGTIKNNTKVTLNEWEQSVLHGALLSMALNLQDQYNLDTETFKKLFSDYFPVSLAKPVPSKDFDKLFRQGVLCPGELTTMAATETFMDNTDFVWMSR